MREKVYSFGQDRDLVGVVTEPDSPSVKEGAPAVLLLNSGLLHRVGPNRMHVKLGRILAGSGYLVFRFDLSGLGDSNRHKDSRSYSDQILGDIQDAMDFFTSRYRHKQFILMGLCTGADNTHKTMVRDERVVGGVLWDGYVYPTFGYKVRHYAPRLFNPVVWIEKGKRLAKQLFSNKGAEVSSRLEGYWWTLPPKEKVVREMEAVASRGSKLLYVFASLQMGYNYESQFDDMFPSLNKQGNIEVKYFKEANHMFTLIPARDHLIKVIKEWMNRNFPGQIRQ